MLVTQVWPISKWEYISSSRTHTNTFKWNPSDVDAINIAKATIQDPSILRHLTVLCIYMRARVLERPYSVTLRFNRSVREPISLRQRHINSPKTNSNAHFLWDPLHLFACEITEFFNQLVIGAKTQINDILLFAMEFINETKRLKLDFFF